MMELQAESTLRIVKGRSSSCNDVGLEHLASIARDQPRGPLIEEIIPRPVDQYEQLVPKADQLNDVNPEPHDPRHKASSLHTVDVRHRRIPTDRGQCALIAVAKRLERLTPYLTLDVAGDELAHLDRDRRDHRQWLTVLLEIRRIADDEDLGMIRNLKRRCDGNAALPTRRNAQRGVER